MPRILRTPTSLTVAEFAGTQRPIRVAAPAAGAEWSLTLPGGAWWRLIGGITTLTTSAVVGSRFATLQYSFAGIPVLEVGVGSLVAASQTAQVNYVGMGGTSAGSASTWVEVGFPPIMMQPGAVLQSHTYARDGGDQYAAVNLLFEEIFTGPDGMPVTEFDTRSLTAEQKLALLGH